jgi:hypothetical protein
MAGTEQRPDDTEGHGYRRPTQDTEAVDDTLAAEDTEGHRRYYQDTEAVDEDQAGDDTEGHRRL